MKPIRALDSNNRPVVALTEGEAAQLVSMGFAVRDGRKKRNVRLTVPREQLLAYMYSGQYAADKIHPKLWHLAGVKPVSRGKVNLERKVRIARSNGDIRRIRVLYAEGAHTEDQWQQLVAESGSRCLCCGVPGTAKTLTRDHVVALAVGGSHDISNIQPLCRSCNSAKHTRSTDYRNVSAGSQV